MPALFNEAMLVLELIIATLIAYLFGSISSAIIVCQLAGLPDPRMEGSRNPGATNVLRIGGKKAALVTLLGDVLKGFIPVLLAKLYGLPDIGIALVTFAAFIGHLFPVFFRFEGGKGVATLIGCLLALSLPAGIAWIITWVLVAALFRYSSLAALIASLLVPFDIWIFTDNLLFTGTVASMSLILFIRHRQNIVNLWHGHENKIGHKK